MNNSLLIMIGLLFVASISLALSVIFNLKLSIVYLAGLILWFISSQIYYVLIKQKQSQQ